MHKWVGQRLTAVRTAVVLLACAIPLLADSLLCADEVAQGTQPGKPLPTGAVPGNLTLTQVRRAQKPEEQIGQLIASGRLEVALKTAEALAKLFKKRLGADHWRSVDMHWDAEALRRVLKRDAASQKAFVGLRGLDQRAAALEARRSYQEALPLREEALTTKRDLLGDEHPETATGYNNLAANLNALGQYAKAEECLRKALKLRRKLLGEEKLVTAESYDVWAHNLCGQGLHAEAEKASRTALALRRKIVGEEHPSTAQNYVNLAGFLFDQGRYVEAETFGRRAVKLYDNLLGKSPANDTTARNKILIAVAGAYDILASSLGKQGHHTANVCTARPAPRSESALTCRLPWLQTPPSLPGWTSSAGHPGRGCRPKWRCCGSRICTPAHWMWHAELSPRRRWLAFRNWCMQARARRSDRRMALSSFVSDFLKMSYAK